MRIIADSGSTKTDWAVAGSKAFIAKTQGINPVLMSREHIVEILRTELLPQLQGQVAEDEDVEVWFYGAGVRPEMEPKMTSALQESLTGVAGKVSASAASDLLGAARALCGRNEGVACILGTGANSCLYDGSRIVRNTPALGFILGDEGGGAALGKAFLNGIFKGVLPSWMREDYLKESGLTLSDIIRKVYREPMPNRFLASLTHYMGRHIDNQQLQQLVTENFRLFFCRNIRPYRRADLPVSFVGSVAYYFLPQLLQAAREEGFELGTVVKSPLQGLFDYHQT